MADLSTKIEEIVRKIEGTDGFTVERFQGGGHKVISPDGQSMVINPTPKNPSTYRNALTRLQRIGWTHDLHKEQEEERRRVRMARHAASADKLNKVGEEKAKTVDVVNEILEDIDLSSWLLTEAVRELALIAHHPHNYNGLSGWLWQGDLFVIARSLWPGLPDARNHPEMARLHTTLIPALRNEKQLIQVRPKPGARSTWWVVAEEPVVEEQPSEESPAPELVDADASADQPQEPSPMKLYTCGEHTVKEGVLCPFRDASEHSLAIHKSKSRGLHAYEGDITCPVPLVYDDQEVACPIMRPTVRSMLQHIHRVHADTRHRCHYIQEGIACLQPFPGLGPLRAHVAEVHPEIAPDYAAAAKKRAHSPSPVVRIARPAPPVVQQPQPPAVAQEPMAAAPVRTVDLESPEGMAMAVAGMLQDYASKKVENDQLRRANAELAEANAQLKAEHAADREQLDNIRATLKSLGLT